MEVAAIAGLVGLGYAVSRLAGKKKSEGFVSQDGFGMTFKPGSQTVALKSPPNSVISPLMNLTTSAVQSAAVVTGTF